jgi:hypothetical protein
MIKMSVYYPANGGSKFDHDYYRTRPHATDPGTARRCMPALRDR